MSCIAYLWWQPRTHRNAVPTEVRALDLAACLYLVHQENHLEWLKLSVSPMPPRHSGHVVWRLVPGHHRVRWVYHPFDRCLLLVNEYLTRISCFSSGWHLYNWALSTKPICSSIWVCSALHRESKYRPSLQWEPIRRGTSMVLSHGWRDGRNV